MRALRLVTERLELKPLPASAARALPEDRDGASRDLGARIPAEWPHPDLLGVLRRQAAASRNAECFGVWVIIERDSGSVVGDIGFHGPPDDAGTIEVGYSVIPDSRRRGYATEAASALVVWALSQPSVHLIVAGCDPNNVPSIRTLERVGFRRTGEANGEIRWRYVANSTRCDQDDDADAESSRSASSDIRTRSEPRGDGAHCLIRFICGVVIRLNASAAAGVMAVPRRFWRQPSNRVGS